MAFRFLVFVFVICIRSLYAEISEEFYILPMGQGNAQLVIYTQGDKKVGVLYDLGSKSLQMHPKFMKRGEWDKKYTSTLKKIGSRVSSLNITPKRSNLSATLSHQIQTPELLIQRTSKISDPPWTVDGKLNPSQQIQHKKNLELFIFDLLQDLSHLFIFISHSDQDHICYLNQNTIPDHVPLTLLFCGDWFGNVGCRKEDTNVTRYVKDVLIFLNSRLHSQNTFTQFNFTYYQNFKNEKIISLNHYIRSLLITALNIDLLIERLQSFCSRDRLDIPVPKFYSGSFIGLYPSLFREQKEDFKKAHPEKSVTDLIEKVKSNIYIWSMNHLSDDINGQSIVISCTLPSLDMSVVFTGDAQHSTFQGIMRTYREKQNFRNILNLDSIHLVLFMLPHHGSRDNSSGSALRFFQPDLFGISAGDGGQHGHPSYELVEMIQENYFFSNEFKNNFIERYSQLKQGLDFTAIQDKKIKLIKSNRRTIPFLCPNLYGCIKWDKDGISTNFDNTLEYNNQDYKILYTSHVWEVDAQTLQSANIGEGIDVFSPYHRSQKCKMILKSKPDFNEESSYVLKKKGKDELFIALEVDSKMYLYRILK